MNSHVPLVAHVIYRLAMGGLENGLINLINHLPVQRYRHAIICLTDATNFSQRIRRNDVTIHELHKREGKDLRVYWRLWKLLRQLKPEIVHSRNLATLEAGVVGSLAGVPIRLHGEHGRDIYDVDGSNRKYKLLRRVCNPFIHRFVPMSQDLATWLVKDVGISSAKVIQLYNGVDVNRFRPMDAKRNSRTVLPLGFQEEGTLVIGTVGRLEAVKDQLTLVKAFLRLRERVSKTKLRLVLFGDGALRAPIEELVAKHMAQAEVWIAGARDDIPSLLPALDIFVLPSLGEGISNTILEAMSCGLPIIATNVGGNPELVVEGETGMLVPTADPDAMATALIRYVSDANLRVLHGEAGRKRVETTFSLEAMVKGYVRLYDTCLHTTEPSLVAPGK